MLLKKKFLIAIFVILICFIIGAIYANKYVKNYGYDGLTDLTQTYFHNKSLANNVDATQLNIDLSKSDFEFIKVKRDVAIDRGVQINVGDNYVDCDINFGSDQSKGEIRLKGHMTDHLQGNKWSYRIKTEKPVLGMYRFSIQHPGTRNYIYEWIYHQLLKNEEIINLNYDFINVTLNGDDLGIYALEEHFGQHVIERNNRPKGAILRWNPELYWDWRIDELQGTFINEEYSHFSSSFVEPYDRGTVKRDTVLLRNYQNGAYLLEMFRRGKMITSEVFDIEKMARFHVIIDLVGGYHSLDWSDVKFYFNSESKKIEPVGYESFSIRKTEKIAGQRVPLNYEEISFNYHDQLFSDPIFYESYIRNMERIVSEDYLYKFMSAIQEELDKKMGVIAKEWPYRKVSFKGYYDNVRLIRNIVDLPKPFHAFIVPDTKDKLTVSIAPVSDFPIEIIGIQRKNKMVELTKVINIPAKARHTYTKYFNINLKNPFQKETNLYLIAKIPGSSHTFKVTINEFPAYKKISDDNDSSHVKVSELDSSLVIALDEHGKKWKFKNSNSTLNQRLLIPDDVTLYLYPNESLTIEDNGKLIVKGALIFQGYSDEEPVSIINKSSGSIVLNNAKFLAKHIIFNGEPLIISKNSDLVVSNSVIYNMGTLVDVANNSNFVMTNCSGGSLKSLGEFNESIVQINESNFSKGNVFLESNGSYVYLIRTNIENYQKAFKLDYGSSIKTRSGKLSGFDTLATLGRGSSFITIGTKLSDAKYGFWWNTKSDLQNRGLIKLNNSKDQNITKLMPI